MIHISILLCNCSCGMTGENLWFRLALQARLGNLVKCGL